jgi:hypothetical protein
MIAYLQCIINRDYTHSPSDECLCQFDLWFDVFGWG